MTQRDAQWLQELIDRHGAALALYARQWCRSPEDAVQEALIDLLRQDSVPEHPAAWLHTAVRRRAMNLARAEARREKHQQQAGLERESWFLPQEGDGDEGIDFQSLLARLPRVEREIVVARVWGQLSFSQIAELVEQSVSSVHRRYHGALAELGRAIKRQRQQLDHPRPTNEPRPTML